jgi:phosphoserine phosphatase
MSDVGQDPAARELVVFDVCDTLYSANTTFGFIRHLARTSGDARLAGTLRRWTSRESPIFLLGALAHRLLGADLARRAVIASLAGWTRPSLETAAEAYVSDDLARRMNAPVLDRLDGHRRAGDRILLVSSSLDIVVAQIARSLGVGFEASTLQFRGACCTGRLTRDLTGRKAELVASLRQPGEALHVYTDNRSDAALVASADSRTIIIPSGASKQRWAGADCEYVEL